MNHDQETSSRRKVMKDLAMATSLMGARSQATPSERPNILYLHSHDTGRYIQPYGYSVPTPHLQKLAEEGILFRRAFDAAPTCSPSRAALLTGQCPHRNGMLGLAHRGFVLNDYRQHILHWLRPHGYRSTLVGIQHIAKDPKTIGYDEVISTKGAHVAEVAPAADAFLKQAPKQPFFLDVGFFETHREFHHPGPQQDVRFTEPPSPVADTPATRGDMAAFCASAQVLDQGVGTVLNALESAGLARNTLVISTTDHGIPFPGMKCNLTVHGTSVYLILRGPGGLAGGKVCDAMVSQMDLYPTICELLHIEKPAWLEGKSLFPLVRGEAPEIHDEIFAEVNYHAAYEPKRAVRTQRYNYIRHFGGKHTPVLPNCDDSPSKELWLKNGWRETAVPRELLFDSLFDPNESRNLVDDPSYATVLREMRRRLDRWMQQTDDPLLRGAIRAPHGAVVNDADGTSPQEPVIPAPSY
jgi:N-sulfoglucosamine sulfohydrolase